MVWIIFAVVAAYFFMVFVALRLVAPFYGFKVWDKVPELPKQMRQKIRELENQSPNQYEYLQAVYNLVLDKTLHQWKHTRFKAGTQLTRGLVSNLPELWNTDKFIYCTQINYLAFCLLAGSKFFKPADVREKVIFLNFVAHQYLQVRVGEQWVDFDPAGIGIRGGGLGQHARIFG